MLSGSNAPSDQGTEQNIAKLGSRFREQQQSPLSDVDVKGPGGLGSGSRSARNFFVSAVRRRGVAGYGPAMVMLALLESILP